jgi:outer membrane protein TolC
VRYLEASVTAAEGALRLSTDQYAQGLISFLPVLTAEQSVYTARSELIAARRELISARIQLARALGGGWMKKDIERVKNPGQDSNKGHTQKQKQSWTKES